MWRFVQISDPHLGSERDGKWNNYFLCTMMPDVFRCLRRDLAELKPDFLLATGDLASQRTRDAVYAARDFLDWLRIPYFPMGGNHDFVLEDSRRWFLEAYHDHLPTQSTYYSFTWKNLHFCVLDPWWLWSNGKLSEVSEPKVAENQYVSLNGARWALPPSQLEWLDNDLKAHKDHPTVLVNHYPAIPIPDRLKHSGMQDAGFLENGKELIELAHDHPQVKAIFAGHAHMHCIEQINGITHVVTGALPEYPIEYRDVHVHDDRLEVYTRGLSDASFAARSLIPGRGWTAGHTRDRHTTIALD